MHLQDQDNSISQSQIFTILLYILGTLWLEAWLDWWRPLLRFEWLGCPPRRVEAVLKR